MENCSKEQLLNKIKDLEAQNNRLENIIAGLKNLNKDAKTNKKSFNFENCKYQHILLKFLYLGWDYHGYVVQEETTNTIEHYLFEALIKTCLIAKRSEANYHRCGRTDKGVSSFSQVVSLDVRSVSVEGKQELNYCKILNRVLPDNIKCIAWCPVDKSFSARFDCVSRTYKYFFPKGTLDIAKMRIASKYLIGTHDFRNFCKMDVDNGVTEFFRNIASVDISGFDDSDNSDYAMYVLTVTGNAFLWHQIRFIVGVLLLIGQKKEEPELILNLLDVVRNPRRPDYKMASEIPLILYDCEFENVNWIYEKENINSVSMKLQQVWTFHAIKSAMVKSMITNLENKCSVNHEHMSDSLITGIKSRNYVPVLKRPLCKSLEDKLQHAQKRKKRKSTTSLQ